MTMGVGPNLVMSGCFALFTLVYFLLQRFYGADVRLWMLIYFPVLLFVMTFSFNHWQQPLKRFIDRLKEQAQAGFWKCIMIIAGMVLFWVIAIILLIGVPLAVFEPEVANQ
jgi:hypothetical protein